MILCMKLQQHKDLKLIFEKYLVTMGPKLGFFSCYQKSINGTFLMFCMESQQQKALK